MQAGVVGGDVEVPLVALEALAGLDDDDVADAVGLGDGFVVGGEKGGVERPVVRLKPTQPVGTRDVPEIARGSR
jgi:hypothetical protein